MSDQGRIPTTAHPMCSCVGPVALLSSLIGILRPDGTANPDWPGIQYENRVTRERRASCVVHKDLT